jgi:hypothetical protein
MLIFNGEFLGWSAGLALSLFALGYIFFFWMTHWVFILLAAGAIMTYGFKWARIFLVRLIIDYEADNGNGRVIIERLLPHPTLPETVQFPLQQAAQGSPEVNTKGLFNTLVTQLKGLRFLRGFVIGDLTLKGPAAPFGITMYSIKDPAGLKVQLEQDWKKIDGLKGRERAEKERNEQIDRMTVAVSKGIAQGMAEMAVTQGISDGFTKISEELARMRAAALLPAPTSDADLPENDYPWSLKTARAGGGKMHAKSAGSQTVEGDVSASDQPGEAAPADSSAPEPPVDPAQAPLGATELTSFAAPTEPPAPGAPPASPAPANGSPASSPTNPK